MPLTKERPTHVNPVRLLLISDEQPKAAVELIVQHLGLGFRIVSRGETTFVNGRLQLHLLHMSTREFALTEMKPQRLPDLPYCRYSG